MKTIHQERYGDEVLTIKAPASECEVHNWPTKGLARRLVSAMRERHPRGVNACTDCVARARDDARPTS